MFFLLQISSGLLTVREVGFWQKSFLCSVRWPCDSPILKSIYVIYNTWWFMYIEHSVNLWNKTNLIMVNDLFYVFLISVCKYFILGIFVSWSIREIELSFFLVIHLFKCFILCGLILVSHMHLDIHLFLRHLNLVEYMFSKKN